MAKLKPIYFLALEVENVRCFGGKQVLDLSDRQGNPSPWTVILGENGVGKTTLLHCLTWMRPAESPPKDDLRPGADGSAAAERSRREGSGESTIAVKPILDDQEEGIFDWFFRSSKNERLSISVRYQIGRALMPNSDDITEVVEIGNQIEREGNKLKEISLKVGWPSEFCEPNLFAYGAGRHMTVRNTDRPELLDPVFNLISDAAELYDAGQVLNDLKYRALLEKESGIDSSPADNFLTKVREMLVDLLPDIGSPEAIDIVGPKTLGGNREEAGVYLTLPSGRISLDHLSLGYKTMLAWAVDFALRLFESKPDSPNPLQEPAIVLVDEVDLHLHPRWQREIRDFLVKHFPNTQFILTAHSPLMAQAAEDDNLAVLDFEDGEVKITNIRDGIKGLRVDQILVSELFNLPSSRSTRIEAFIKERRKLVDSPARTPNENTRLTELDGILHKLPTEERREDQEDIDLIREVAMEIRSLTTND